VTGCHCFDLDVINGYLTAASISLLGSSIFKQPTECSSELESLRLVIHAKERLASTIFRGICRARTSFETRCTLRSARIWERCCSSPHVRPMASFSINATFSMQLTIAYVSATWKSSSSSVKLSINSMMLFKKILITSSRKQTAFHSAESLIVSLNVLILMIFVEG